MTEEPDSRAGTLIRGRARRTPWRPGTATHAVSLALLLLTSSAAGCASSEGSGGEASCALALRYRSQIYYGHKTEKPVEPGRALGEVGYPPCDDTGGQHTKDQAAEEDAAARFRAYAVHGVDPAEAFVVPTRYPRYVFVLGGPRGSAIPPELERLLNR